MPLLYIAVIDLCFTLDVDVPLICALITAVYRKLTFKEKRFDQRETRQSSANCPYKIRPIKRDNLPKKIRKIVLHVRQIGFRQIVPNLKAET